VLRCPRFAARIGMAPLVALWLLAVLALLSATFVPGAPTSLLDYKIGLPILALLVAPNLRAALGRFDLARFALLPAGFYVGATAALALALPSLAMLRNVAGHVSGSTSRARWCCTRPLHDRGPRLGRRLAQRPLALDAARHRPGAGGRRLDGHADRHPQPLLTVGLFVVLWVLHRVGSADLARPRLLGTGLLALWPSWRCRSGPATRSGRGSPISATRLFLRPLALDPPLADPGRGPALRARHRGRPRDARRRPADHRGGHLLEWPHNEFVRFFVEGGVLGLMLVLVVVGEALRRARRRALVTADPVERVLLLAIAADMLAQCLLQNYFNSVYHATVMLMLLGMLAADDEEVESPREGGASPRPHRYSVR
jgi:hypothetical protein